MGVRRWAGLVLAGAGVGFSGMRMGWAGWVLGRKVRGEVFGFGVGGRACRKRCRQRGFRRVDGGARRG